MKNSKNNSKILEFLPNYVTITTHSNKPKQRKLNIKFTIFKLFNFLLIFTVTLFSIKGSGFHHDSGLYHLNYQNILRTNKIQFGLVNLYDHYGFSSFYEYIGSIFWIGENLILLQIIPLII